VPADVPADGLNPFGESNSASDAEAENWDEVLIRPGVQNPQESPAFSNQTTIPDSTSPSLRNEPSVLTPPSVEQPAAEENPFSGVQLDMSDEQLFGPAPTASPRPETEFDAAPEMADEEEEDEEEEFEDARNPFGGQATPLRPLPPITQQATPLIPQQPAQNFAEPARTVESAPPVATPDAALPQLDGDITGRVRIDNESLGGNVPPMEDFEDNLPSISLPMVDEVDAPNAGGTAQQHAPAQKEGIPGRQISMPSTPREPEIRVDDPQVNAERERQAAEADRRERQRQMIASRSGQTGFKGFCPVMLRDYRELVDANAKYTGTFGLQTYTFSSAQALAEFEVDPARYAPAAGGSDIVLLVNSGEEQPGLLDFALWYRDRLYLFRSRETMTEFSRDPRKYANQY
ncbi:MAG: hypothetical protein KDA85_14165, partial [Planctomycetaceae bacterium]|nr:hypothetical protein [Planctomycetaceae bacterium]